VIAFSGVVEALALPPGKEEDQNGGQGKRHAGDSKASVDSRAPFSEGSDARFPQRDLTG
jgi:hypothetical protein